MPANTSHNPVYPPWTIPAPIGLNFDIKTLKSIADHYRETGQGMSSEDFSELMGLFSYHLEAAEAKMSFMFQHGDVAVDDFQKLLKN